MKKILYIILIPVLILNLIFILSTVINPRKVPSVAGYTPLIVESGSMMPVMEVGDIAIVRSFTAETGDVKDRIIAWHEGEHIVTHRIIETEVQPDGTYLFYTKGDANNSGDKEPVRSEQVIGEYVFLIPKAGKFLWVIQSPAVIACAAVLMMMYCVYGFIRSVEAGQASEK